MNDYKVPKGYALISEEALREWGKLEEVREMCAYPISKPVSEWNSFWNWWKGKEEVMKDVCKFEGIKGVAYDTWKACAILQSLNTLPVNVTKEMVEAWVTAPCPDSAGMSDEDANFAHAQANWTAMLNAAIHKEDSNAS